MKHESSPTMPLFRRAIKPDEWPETYAAELARMNGVRSPRGRDIHRIRGALSLPGAAGSTLRTIEQQTRQGSTVERTQCGGLLPRWACLHPREPVRYCPMCLAADRYVRSRWRIPQLKVCSKHGCYLKNDLAEPALTYESKREGLVLLHEATTEGLQQEALCCLPEEYRILKSIWATFENAAEASARSHADDKLGEMAAWSLLSWRLLEAVAQAHIFGVRHARSMGTLANIALMVRESGSTIEPNREGVTAFLHGLGEYLYYKAALHCLRVLIAKEVRERSVLSMLPLMQLRDSLIAAAPHLSVVTKSYGRVFREERDRYLGMGQVMDELDVTHKLLGDWMRAGWFQNITIRKLGVKRFVFIGRDDVRRVRQFLLSLISVEAFVVEHGLDWPTYLALRKGGLLHPIEIGGRRHLRRREIATLLCRFEMASAPLPSAALSDHALFGNEIIEFAHRAVTYSALLQAAVAGEIPVYRDLERPGLSSFRVGAEALVWLKARRAADIVRRRAGFGHAQLELVADAA